MFDTDICIYLLNQKPGHESILKRLAKLELFLASFEVVPFDDRAAFTYGPLRVHLQAQGTPIGPLDALIAAHAARQW